MVWYLSWPAVSLETTTTFIHLSLRRETQKALSKPPIILPYLHPHFDAIYQQRFHFEVNTCKRRDKVRTPRYRRRREGGERAAFALFHPSEHKSPFGQTHPPAQPHYPCVISPLAAQANDPQLRPRFVGSFAVIRWKVKGRNGEGTLLSSTGERRAITG